MKKKLGLVIILGMVIFLGVLTINNVLEEKTLKQVTEDAFENFGIQSIHTTGDEDPRILVDVYDMEDSIKVEGYLEENLSNDDSEKYDIKVFSRNGIDYDY